MRHIGQVFKDLEYFRGMRNSLVTYYNGKFEN